MTLKENAYGTKPDATPPPAGAAIPPPFNDGSVAEDTPLASSVPQTIALDWLAALPDAALVMDNRGAIVEVNAPAAAMFGYPRAELVGRPVAMIVPERLRAKHAKHTADYFAAPRLRSRHAGLELSARHKDGSEFLVTITLSPVPAAPVTFALAVVRDITAQKRVEATLQRRITDLSVLNRMATIVTEAMDEDEIITRVMDEALHLVGVEFAAIRRLDQAAGELILVAHRGTSDEFVRATSRVKLGEGVSGRVAQTGEPIIIGTLAEYPGELKELLEQERIQSIAGVPLVGRTGLLGVMNLGAPNPDSFDSAGMELLLTLARQMAIGIEQTRLYAETRRQNRHLSVLYTVNRATSQSLNLEEILQSAMLATVEALDVEKGGIYLFDDDGESLVLHAHYGHSDDIIRRIQRLNAGEGISGQAIAQQQPVVLDSAEHPTERFAKFIRQQVRTLVSVPLWASGRVVGAFTLGTVRAHAFPTEERDLLTAIGQQLGSAVQNARLYEAVQQELTERKQAEKALLESEQKFRVLSEQSLLAMGIIQDGMLKYVNQAFVDIGGYSIDEVMSWTPADQAKIIHPDDRALVMEQGRKKQAGDPDSVTNYQYRTITKNGETKWLDLYSKTVLYQGRTASFFMVVDITERKRAEELLQRYNQRLMHLHEIDRNIIMAHSPKTIADTVLAHIRRLIPCWRASVLLYEPDTNEIVILASAANGQTAIQPDVRFAAPAEQMSQLVLTERYYLVEDIHTLPEPIPPLVRLAIAEGTHSYLNVLLVVEQKLIGALTLGSKTRGAFTEEDIQITIEVANQIAIAIHQARLKEAIERHSAELEQRVARRTAQLEAANKELESFSYSVSHDLRAPLRAINGFAAIIARRHRPNLNEEGRHYADNIVLASDRMGELIDDLLQYSRLGRGGARRKPVPLREVFDPLASDLAGHLAEIGGTLSLADDLPTVMGDRTLLGRVFTNLLENAVTYRQADVPVQVTVSCQVEGQDVIVCVGDNGIGIPAQHHHKVFNIFQRLHSDDDYPGTGIGLATVKKSVELLGGQVWIESVVGEGSKFFIQLPKESDSLS
ncbi:MAG: GAF domain-containing protein [Anaerolineaceae bacterium]|nr:GAF domain-containing protein [Anaerolineaceae bacterium]MCB9100629.1 GAF domain-containing protein [Anaerolineales bacterium]